MEKRFESICVFSRFTRRETPSLWERSATLGKVACATKHSLGVWRRKHRVDGRLPMLYSKVAVMSWE